METWGSASYDRAGAHTPNPGSALSWPSSQTIRSAAHGRHGDQAGEGPADGDRQRLLPGPLQTLGERKLEGHRARLLAGLRGLARDLLRSRAQRRPVELLDVLPR